MAESGLQYMPLTETVSALRTRFIDRTGVYLAGGMLVYYRMNDNTVSVAPDLFAVLVAGGNRPRGSWTVWREGKVPSLVVEIASERTWCWDADEKRHIYAGMGIAEYWRFDSTGGWFTPTTVGERLVGGEY